MRRRHQVAHSMAPILAIQGSLVLSGVLSARLLGPDLRGYLTLAILLPGVVAIVATLGLPNAVVQFTVRERAAAPTLLADSLALLVPMIIVAEVANVVLLWILFNGVDPRIREAVMPTLLVAPALLVQLIAAAHLQGMGRYAPMNGLRVAPYVLYAAGVVACYAFGAHSLSLIVWSFALAYLVVAIASIMIIRTSLADPRASGHPTPRRELLSFGARGFAVTLSPIESFRADQLFVGAVFPAAQLGYYSIATAFSVMPRLITQSLGLLASAEVAMGGEQHRRATVRSYLGTAVILVLPSVLAVEVLLPVLIQVLFGEAFLPALTSARLLLLAAATLGLRRIVTDLLRGLGRPGVESIAEIASWPVLAAGAILIVVAGAVDGGIEGVAGVVLTASAVSLVVALVYLARVWRYSSTRLTAEPGS